MTDIANRFSPLPAKIDRQVREKRKRQIAFLKAFEQLGVIGPACQVAGIVRHSEERWRKQDDEFRAIFEDIEQGVVDRWEQEAVRRGVEGVLQPLVSAGRVVMDENGEPMTYKVYSDQLLMFILRGRRPGVYNDRRQVEISGPGGGPLELQAVRQRIETELDQLADKVEGDWRRMQSYRREAWMDPAIDGTATEGPPGLPGPSDTSTAPQASSESPESLE